MSWIAPPRSKELTSGPQVHPWLPRPPDPEPAVPDPVLVWPFGGGAGSFRVRCVCTSCGEHHVSPAPGTLATETFSVGYRCACGESAALAVKVRDPYKFKLGLCVVGKPEYGSSVIPKPNRRRV